MRKTTVVIYTHMAEDDPFHVSRPDAERAQLRTDFLITVDPKRNFPSDIGVKRLAPFDQMGGATVSVVAAQKDSGLTATILTAEKDGVKPI